MHVIFIQPILKQPETKAIIYRQTFAFLPNQTSNHILGTSANLLGFCLIVLTSLHFTNKTENSIIDEVTSVIGMFLIMSCIFSFVAIRSRNDRSAEKLETIADYLFLSSLVGIFVVIFLITIKYWLH